MPDVWTAFSELDADTQQRLVGLLETRGADPQQRPPATAPSNKGCAGPFPPISPSPNACVLEVGCGMGVLTRQLALRPDVGAVVGVDAAPSLLDEARERTAGLPDPRFREADARSLPFTDGTFDTVVWHLAAFDGD